MEGGNRLFDSCYLIRMAVLVPKLKTLPLLFKVGSTTECLAKSEDSLRIVFAETKSNNNLMISLRLLLEHRASILWGIFFFFIDAVRLPCGKLPHILS